MALQVKDFSLTAKSGHGKITYTYTIRVTENSVDLIKNSSHVTVEAILKQTFSGTAFSGYRTGVSCDINGQNLFSDYCRRTIAGREEHVFYTWTGDMPHEADGRLTLGVTGKLWQTKAADYTPPTMIIPEGVMELTPIARASRVGADDTVIGSRSTVVITPAAEEFRHTLSYQFGQLSGYLCQDGSICPEPVLLTGTTVSFEIPESFYAEIPDKPWENCTITCATYNGEACIGTNTAIFRITAEESRCAPLVQLTASDICPETVALTGDPGRVVRYMSVLQVQLQAKGQYGSQILLRQVNGVSLSDEYLEIPAAESGEINALATDSRGYRTQAHISLPEVAYVKLTNNATAARTAPTTGQARLTFSGNCFHGSFGAADNSLRISYRLCPENGEYGDWQELACPIGQDHTYRLETVVSGLDYTKSYTIHTRVEDALDAADCLIPVMPGIPVFNWYKDRFVFRVPVECDSSISGAFICRHTLYGADTMSLLMQPGQTVLVVGAGGLVCGATGSSGSWWGSEAVTAQAENERVTLTFSQSCSGEFLLISAQPVCIE